MCSNASSSPRMPLTQAESTIGDRHGIYTLTDRKRGQKLLYGDVVIQIIDLQPSVSLQMLVRDYLWSAEETRGFYEGQSVRASRSGVGMLANGRRRRWSDERLITWSRRQLALSQLFLLRLEGHCCRRRNTRKLWREVVFGTGYQASI